MAIGRDPIRVEGLRELQTALRRMDKNTPRRLRLVLNDAADLVVSAAQPRIARRSGRAAASMKPASGQREASVRAGGARVPYYGWLDFGGAVGRNNSVRRPFMREGRYLYPAYRDRKAAIRDKIRVGLDDLIRESGLDPS